jgi:co-chaperonin GroES (HSP10)
MFVPDNGTALVEVYETSITGGIETPEDKYRSYHRGKVLAIDELADAKKYKKFLDAIEVYFEEFQDTCQVEDDGKIYAFIDLEKIKGHKV